MQMKSGRVEGGKKDETTIGEIKPIKFISTSIKSAIARMRGNCDRFFLLFTIFILLYLPPSLSLCFAFFQRQVGKQSLKQSRKMIMWYDVGN